MSDIAFNAHLPNGWQIQVTENYEGDRYHVVVFDNKNQHVDTREAGSSHGVFNIMRECFEEEA